MKIPRSLIFAAIILVFLTWVPLVLVARARVSPSAQPRIHPILDMDKQPKFKAQEPNPIFADERAMRPPVAGTVAVGSLDLDPVVATGKTAAGDWVTTVPLPVTMSLMKRGQQEFGIYCAPCHGLSGYGDGPVAKRADRLREGTWTPPASLHSEVVLGRADGHLFNTITHGIRSMPPYGPQIAVRDRWAIVLYVRALQRSQGATIADVPPELRASLR